MNPAAIPLAGLRVLEIAGLGPAPYCGMLLADLGADVVRVDRPTQACDPVVGDRILGRGKRSVQLDLKADADRAIFLELAAVADVVLEPFRPGVAERLGVGPDDCNARNSRLVYGRLTGWGQDGPLSGHAGHDLNYIALAGVLDLVRADPADPPGIPANLVGDMAGGGLLMAFGLVCAVLRARESGSGTVVDVSMVDGANSLMAIVHEFHLASADGLDGTAVLRGQAPYYTTYPCADGERISIAAVEPQFYRTLLRCLGLDETALPQRDDPANWPSLRATFSGLFAQRSRAEWVERLGGESELCFAPVLTLPELPTHPHHRAREAFIEVHGVMQPAPVPRFGTERAPVPAAPPVPGGDREAVLLAWLGDRRPERDRH